MTSKYFSVNKEKFFVGNHALIPQIFLKKTQQTTPGNKRVTLLETQPDFNA
jgi:hypothetical protein